MRGACSACPAVLHLEIGKWDLVHNWGDCTGAPCCVLNLCADAARHCGPGQAPCSLLAKAMRQFVAEQGTFAQSSL